MSKTKRKKKNAEDERKNKELQVLVSGYLIRSGYNKKRACRKAGHEYRFTLQQTQRFRQVYFFRNPQVI